MNNKEVLKYIIEIYNVVNTEFKKYIDNQEIFINNQTNQIVMYFDNETETFNYEFAGYYDSTNNNWYWAWILPNNATSIDSITNKILNYGLSINNQIEDSLENLYKQSFINPILNLKNNIELDNHIALILSILQNKVKFIYNHKIYLDATKKKYIINYYYILY
jgi:hypothetical protein